MNRIVSVLLASTMAVSFALPAAAQNYYERDSQYQSDRANYDAQMRDYDASRAQYERDRDAYDRQYGYGSYERSHGRFDREYPRTNVDATATVPRPSACAQARADAKSSRIGGTILGAIIGGALGSNIAASGHRSDGTAVGAVVGGVIGNKVGGDTKAGAYSAACDSNGAYYNYEQTFDYREGRDGVARGQHNARYYTDNRCRLAPATTDRGEYAYVRVCPDRDGRYRVAG